MLPGTGCRSQQAPDGTWTIFDVPLVPSGSVPLYGPGGDLVGEFAITHEWMERAIGVHAKRMSEGYLGRAFVDHHASGSASQPDAGYIVPTHMGEIAMDGEQRETLFGNMIAVPDSVYQEWIKAHRVPYRSIESLHPDSAFIDGLALMPTRSPHFRMPILTIGHETAWQANETMAARGRSSLRIACASPEHVSPAIRRATTMSKRTAGKVNAMDDGPKDDIKDGGPPKGNEAPQDTGSAWKAKIEELQSCDVQASDIPEFVAALREFADSLSPEGAAADPEIDASSTDIDPAEVVADPVLARRVADAEARAIRADATAIAASGKAQAVENVIAMRDAVDAAMDQLQGYAIGSDPRAVLTAKAKEYGITGFGLFVETIKAHGMRSPGSAAALSAGSEMDALPQEVMAVTEPRERAIAIQTYKRITEAKARGFDVSQISIAAAIRRDIATARG